METTGNGRLILRRSASTKDVSHVFETALLPGRTRTGRADGTYAPVSSEKMRLPAAQGLRAAQELRLRPGVPAALSPALPAARQSRRAAGVRGQPLQSLRTGHGAALHRRVRQPHRLPEALTGRNSQRIKRPFAEHTDALRGCPVCGAMLCDECAEREQGLCADCAAAGRDE